MPSWPSRRIFRFFAALQKPKSWSLRAKELGLVGLGIADRNSVAGVVRSVTAMAKGRSEFKLAVGARLVFSDGTPDILAYPEDRVALGPPHPFADRLERIARKKATAFSGFRISGRSGRPQSHCHAAAADQCRAHWSSCFAVSRKRPRRRRCGLPPACFIAATIAAECRNSGMWPTARFVPLIAVNDVLYHVPERRALQDVVTCIREHRTLEEAGRLLRPMPSGI